ncbi:putative two-component system sensor kinase [Actinoplanes missouriensis 431]|uniref:histidine kinase n=1 Tax=Actinoplanes missouriensis (strain ATCC 14538 / DSM 43046 / CBS 188.64 / JCM 3121 / NBRC 102363 / NCIMB 12654 / NRRL B-3342 / UNCC 431) TaxID=512565 RepID=I0HJJ4_ACTM4|nr:histidine kinase [Actinoplanes missouriensis]BAL93181.1 putative two-component system sensor kinase [Actinoplanes missouriensis 431]
MLIIFPGRRGPQRVAAVLFAAVVAALVVAEGLDGPTLPAKLGVIASGLLAVAVLLLAEARPSAVAAAAALSLTVSVACALVPALRLEHTFGIVEFAALSVTVIRLVMQHPIRRAAGPAALTILAIGLLPLRVFLHPVNVRTLSQDGALVAMVLTAWVLFVALLGLYLRLLERRRVDADRLARQAERLDQARDLHDYVAHHVTAIVAQTQAIRFVTSSGAAPSAEDLDRLLIGVEQAGGQALTSMRTLVGILRDETPATAPAHGTLDEMLTAVTGSLPPGHPTPVVSVDESLSHLRLPDATLDAAHHTVLEALTNVLRHTTGTTRIDIGVRVRPGRSGLAEVSVRNDGQAAVSPLPAGGFGLTGLSERVRAAGGELTAGPVTGGWQVTAVLPIRPEARRTVRGRR